MTKITSVVVGLALCSALAGCSGEAARQTLTSPSQVSESGPVSAVSDDRSGSTRSANSAETRAWASSHGWAMDATGLVVEGTDTITAVSGSCPTKSITVRGVPVALTATTTFTAPITCASLAADMAVKVTALLTYTASGFTVTATNVGPAGDGGEDGDDDDDDESGTPGTGGGGKKARGEGVIGAITGSCPTLTLIITGTRVSTTGSTTYENGSCETLRQGTKVTIDGELRPGGTAVAEHIIIRSVPGNKLSGDGRVDSVDESTSCPALSFTVRGVKIVTGAATAFTGGECADLRRGSHVDVTGDYDGTELTASAVHIRKP